MKKILLVNDFSQIKSGYGVYGQEILKRFHNDGFEVAELAVLCSENDSRIQNCPWKVFPNQPKDRNLEYESNPVNVFGKWKFEEVCIEFQPDCVLDIRDVYSYEFEMHSPFRKFYNWIVMAPVDGLPQHNQWIHIYNNADGLIGYTNWSKKVLENYGLKVDGVAAPAASKDFFPLSISQIKKIKETFGLGDNKIAGTIMRNQPRKLFNELFAGFRKALDKDPSLILYCHTTYPDAGWDLSELLIKHNIASSVLFTYKCKNCNNIFPSFFQDMRTYCPICREYSAKMPDQTDFVENNTLNKIINIFDCYLQISCREGFGMPQCEAAACNVPIVNVPYAGMEDMVDTLSADPVNILGYWFSYDMMMEEAIPDVNDIGEKILKNVHYDKNDSTVRNKFLENYSSWDKTYEIWKEIINKMPNKTWQAKKINNPPEMQNLPNDEFANFLVRDVLEKPELQNSFLTSRIIKDLNIGITFGGIYGNYFTECISCKKYEPFNKQIAYETFLKQRQYNDYWMYQLAQK